MECVRQDEGSEGGWMHTMRPSGRGGLREVGCIRCVRQDEGAAVKDVLTRQFRVPDEGIWDVV